METFEHILLFKTNIVTGAGTDLQFLLNQHEQIEHWNIDMHDDDRILRVVSHTLKHQEIIELITSKGFDCTELV